MDFKRLYLPDHQKWLKYYQARGVKTSEVAGNNKRKRHQIGGSIGKSYTPRVIPIESKTEKLITKSDDPIQINLVSPAEATVQQAESELSREAEELKHIKRKSSGGGSASKRNKQKKRKEKKKRKTSKTSTDIFSLS